MSLAHFLYYLTLLLCDQISIQMATSAHVLKSLVNLTSDKIVYQVP